MNYIFFKFDENITLKNVMKHEMKICYNKKIIYLLRIIIFLLITLECIFIYR